MSETILLGKKYTDRGVCQVIKNSKVVKFKIWDRDIFDTTVLLLAELKIMSKTASIVNIVSSWLEQPECSGSTHLDESVCVVV